jgi:drug/metabolite transporter (DMT)-like permease
MIGHALALGPRPAARFAWDRWIALGFAIGSACFFVGPFPGFVQLVGQSADAVLFFAGSVFFTLAAGAELRETTLRLHRRFSGASWWSAAVQFAGTLWFNVSTFHAMQTGLSTHQQNRLVWAPDLIGSGCFLASGALAYGVTTGPHLLPARVLPAQRDHAWKMAAINLAGCVLFAVSSVASFVVPSTGSVLALAPANWCTALGALCFFIGAVLLSRRRPDKRRAAARPLVSQEV